MNDDLLLIRSLLIWTRNSELVIKKKAVCVKMALLFAKTKAFSFRFQAIQFDFISFNSIRFHIIPYNSTHFDSFDSFHHPFRNMFSSVASVASFGEAAVADGC